MGQRDILAELEVARAKRKAAEDRKKAEEAGRKAREAEWVALKMKRKQ